MKKALFLAIIFFIIATTACRKTNNSQTPNSLTNNFSVSVEVENNQLNLLAGEDTATILISITSSLPTSTYTLVASDTTIYNKNPVLPNNTIVSNAKPSITYMIGYTSKTPNPAKVLTFTVTDNNGKQELQNKTFNIRTGFVANVYPTSPSVFFGGTDSLIVNIKGSAGITGQYTISFSNDTVYYQSLKYKPGAPINLSNNLSDTLTYLAITGPTFNAGAKQLNFTVNLSSLPDDQQMGNVTINLLNSSFMPVITPKQTNIYRGSFDTVTVAITNAVNPNTTYSIKIDSAFIYKGVSYEGGSMVILQNLRGNNSSDSIVFQGRGLGAFNPTLTIKNLLVDSTATAQTQKLQLNVVGITLQSPANNAIDQPVQPIFVWNNTNPSIISYKVYYGTNQNSLVQDMNNYTVNNNRSDTIRISPDGGTTSPYLSYATQYYWKVVGINASGAPVDSNSSSFTVRNALNLNEVRAHIGLAAYKDSLYAAGGDISNSTSDVRNDAEIFSQATDWKISPQILNAARYSFGLTAYKDSLYAVGGHGVNPGVLGSVEVFSPATGWNTSAQTLGTARQNFGLIAYRDTLFVIGGEGDNRLSSVETFYTGGSWVTSPKSLNANRSEFGVAVANDKIYVAGGLISNGTLNTTVESYDGMNWSNAEPTMKTARYTFGMTSYNNKVYAVGGKAAGNTLNSLEIFDGSSWQYGTPMPTAREAVNFIEYKGLLYAVGGINENSQFLSIVEIYNPTTNQWQ